jgi:hypothetical protein
MILGVPWWRRSSRAARAATAFLAVTWFSAAAATSAHAARILIPWTQQTVFALGPTDDYVAEWMGLSSGWIEIGGPATAIYAGSAGVFELDSSGNIWMYDGTPFEWTEIGGPGQEFAEGGGHLYGLGPNGDYVAEWNGPGAGWTVIGGPAANIYAGPDGLVETAPGTYGVSGDISYYDGTPGSWTDIGGPASTYWVGSASVAVGANAVYRIDPPNAAGVTDVDEWTGGTSWTPILTTGSGDDVLNLLAGDDGVYLYDVTATTDYYLEYDGTPNSWSPVSEGNDDTSTGPIPDAESRTSLYGFMVNTAGTGGVASVEIYSGSGMAWTVIGGPADAPLAAGD